MVCLDVKLKSRMKVQICSLRINDNLLWGKSPCISYYLANILTIFYLFQLTSCLNLLPLQFLFHHVFYIVLSVCMYMSPLYSFACATPCNLVHHAHPLHMLVGVVICNILRMLKNEMRHHSGMMSHFTFHTIHKTYLEEKKKEVRVRSFGRMDGNANKLILVRLFVWL